MYVKGKYMCEKGECMYVKGECVCVRELEWIMSTVYLIVYCPQQRQSEIDARFLKKQNKVLHAQYSLTEIV